MEIIQFLGVVFLLLCISFILALRSLKDINMNRDLEKDYSNKKKSGTILLLKDKVIHYSSSSSESDSSSDS